MDFLGVVHGWEGFLPPPLPNVIPDVPKNTLHNFKPVYINVASRYLKNIFMVQKTIA